MYIIASLFFVAGITAGGVYGFMAKKTVMDIIFLSITGGFAGSAAGGIVFIYLYLTGRDEDIIDEQKYGVPGLNYKSNSEITPYIEKNAMLNKFKQNLFHMFHIPNFRYMRFRFPEFKFPQLKFTVKHRIEKPDLNPPRTKRKKQESDKQKIKRLKKEIKKIKNKQ